MSGRAPSMTRSELDALDDLTVDLVTAARALGLGRTKAHELVRAGDFPLDVLRLGRKYRVKTADLRRFLGIDAPTASQ